MSNVARDAEFRGVDELSEDDNEGYFGVLAHHAAMVTALASGTMKVRVPGGAEQSWSVAGGFFEVSSNRTTALADAVGAAKG